MEQNNNLVNFQIRSEDLPAAINAAVRNINEIGDRISEATQKAEMAKKAADEAAEKSAGWSLWGRDKREAIEALQKAVVGQANAITNSVDASRVLFEHQKMMIQAIRYLFGMGVANMAANRTIVRELEHRLRYSSKSELTGLARQELINVILQLRAQEDVMEKLNNHDALFREHLQKIEDVRNKMNRIEQSFSQSMSEIESIKTKVLELNNVYEGRQNRLVQEQNIEKVSVNSKFIDSAVYKIIIGVIALAALLFSIIF